MLAMAGMMMGVAPSGGGGGFTSIAGIAFRSTAAYVTDNSGDTYCLGEAYPVTRSAANGDSATFGYVSNSGIQKRDRDNTLNPSIAGFNFHATAAVDARVHAPDGPGTYTVYLGLGDSDNPNPGFTVTLKDSDNSTVLHTQATGAIAYTNTGDAAGNTWPHASWAASGVGVSVTLTGSDLYVGLDASGVSDLQYIKLVRTA